MKIFFIIVGCLFIAFVIFARSLGGGPDPDYGKKLVERVRKACIEQYPNREDLSNSCQINLLAKAMADNERKAMEQARSKAGL